MNNKAIIEFGFCMIWRILQISEGFIDLGLWPRSVDKTLIDLQNSLYPTQPHSIITNYSIIQFLWQLLVHWVTSDVTFKRGARVNSVCLLYATFLLTNLLLCSKQNVTTYSTIITAFATDALLCLLHEGPKSNLCDKYIKLLSWGIHFHPG